MGINNENILADSKDLSDLPEGLKMIETGPKKEVISKSIEVGDVDLQDAKLVAKFLCKIGFLEKEPSFLKGTLIKLL